MEPISQVEYGRAVEAVMSIRDVQRFENRPNFVRAAAQVTEPAQMLAQQSDVRVNSALKEAFGAETRLSIRRSDETGEFVYRAFDVETGKTIFVWPAEQLMSFLREITSDLGPNAVMLNRVR